MAPRKPAARPGTGYAEPEIDYGKLSGDPSTLLARDRIPVRSLGPGDLEPILRIDRRQGGRTRRAYYRRKLAEALEESAVRVSLAAEHEGGLVGFVMARVDFGEFGNVEPEAVIEAIGVDPGFRHKGIGRALISQLFTNLSALRVERVRTEVAWNHFGLLQFLERVGFEPHRRLALRRIL